VDELNYTTVAYIYSYTLYIYIIISQKIAQTSGVVHISWDLSTLYGTCPGDFSYSHSDGRAKPGESALLFRRPREKTTAARISRVSYSGWW